MSKVLHGPENRYLEIEKTVFAVIKTSRKLRPYFLSHRIKIRTHFPFQKTLRRPDLSGRMVKWAVELGEYEIEFEPRTAINAHPLAAFIQETTRTEENKVWRAYVDGFVT